MQAFLNILVGKVSNTVLSIVHELNGTEWTDEVKRKEAFAKIKLYITHAGFDIKDSAINTAIEIAVQILKGKTA